LVGPDEENLQSELHKKLGADAGHAHFVPFVEFPETYMAAADLFVLPSHREGFGSVVIEAAACGLPAVVSRIYGLSDAVEDNCSGILVDVKDVEALATAMKQFALNRKMTIEYGCYAKERARGKFSQRRLTSAVINLYQTLLGAQR
jgi:glycosyltransferase involved in cell wall biosynthesis